MDLGQKRRGVDMGPSAIRYAGLQNRLERLGCTVYESGNITVPQVEQVDDNPIDGLAHNIYAIGEVCRDIYANTQAAMESGETVIVLGGDHSISLGTVPAALATRPHTGVLWVDAHGDFNTPFTTPSGNVHGMVVSALTGSGSEIVMIGERRLPTAQVAMIGIRDLDAEERVNLTKSDVTVRTMRDIDEIGMAAAVRQVLDAFGDVEALHISLDMDSLDPQFAPGVGTPVPGGLSYREAHLLMEMLADDGRVRSLDVVEINPILDDSNRTAKVAVELVASLFGQRIL
jgi:arginase